MGSKMSFESDLIGIIKRQLSMENIHFVLLDSLNLSSEQIDSLQKDQFLSRMGFAIVETTTRLPIVVLLEDQH